MFATSLPSTFITLQITVGTTPVQLTATRRPITSQPFVRPEAGATATVAVIKDNTQTLAQGMLVNDGLFVPIDDLSKIWLIASANVKVSVIAGV